MKIIFTYTGCKGVSETYLKKYILRIIQRIFYYTSVKEGKNSDEVDNLTIK